MLTRQTRQAFMVRLLTEQFLQKRRIRYKLLKREERKLMDVIKKSQSTYLSNLPDYEKIRKDFDVKDYYQEFEWFAKDKLNAAYNAIDRHARGERKNKVALYWEGENGEKKKYTFQEMSLLSNKFGNLLKSLD